MPTPYPPRFVSLCSALVLGLVLGAPGDPCPAAAARRPSPMERAWTFIDPAADTLVKRRGLEIAHAWADSVGRAAQARGDRATYGMAVMWRGQRYGTHEYEWDQAVPFFERGLAVARALRDTFGIALTLREHAYAAQLAGKIDLARKDYTEAARLARRIGARDVEGLSRWGLGAIFKNDGRYPEAKRELAQVQRLLAPTTFQHLHAEFLHAEVLNRTGERDEAREMFEAVLAEARKRRNRWMTAAALNDLGIVAFEQGDWAAANRNWAVAATHFDTLAMRDQDRGSAINTRVNQANALIQLGRIDEARVLLERQAQLASQIPDPEIRLGVLASLGTIERRAGRHTEAERTLRAVIAAERASGFDAKNEEEATIELARLLRETGRPAAAEDVLDSLLVPARRVRMTKDNASAALLERSAARRARGLHSEALEPAREAERLARREAGKTSIYALDAAVELARVRRALGQADSAVAGIARAARAWERWRAEISDFEWRERASSGLAGLYGEYGLALLDARRGGTAATRARQAFDALQAFQARTLEERMQGVGLAGRAMARRVTADSLRRVVLGADEVLLDLVATPDTTFAFVVSKRGIEARLLPGLRRLEPLFADWRSAALGGATEAVAEAGLRRLSDELLAPVTDALRPAKRLIVTGGGGLVLWPVAALTLPGESAPLDATREVVSAPSATLFALLRARGRTATGPGDLLAVSRSTDAEGRALPGAERELDLLDRAYARVVVRMNRGESTVRDLTGDLARFDALHFAAHADAVRGSPWRSGFLLGRGNGDDAYLRAASVARMKLKARLAVLSGCQSAGATALAGEGALGLSSGFLCAGTTTVVATLWPVEDRTAERYMAAFYAGLAEGKSASAAARAARTALRTRAETAHPKDWAAFVLVGEPGTRLPLAPRRAS